MRKARSAAVETGPPDANENGDRINGGFDLPSVTGSSVVRTTIVFSAQMDLNLELCRLKLGVSKNEVIKRAIHTFLIQEGFDPLRPPRNVGVSY